MRTVGGPKAGREGEGHGEALSVPVSLLPTLHSFLPGEEMVKHERKRRRRKKRQGIKNKNKTKLDQL